MPEHKEKQQGQGMVEYIIIVMVVSLASIAAYSFFGQEVRGQTAQMAVQVSGGESQGVHGNSVNPGGNGKHCCGVRPNPPAPMEAPLQVRAGI